MAMTLVEAVAAPANSTNIDSSEPKLVRVDPDMVALFAEVDAILCAALAPARFLPALPVTGCALVEPRWAGRSCGAPVRARRAPVRHVRAVQRSPPGRAHARDDASNDSKERQVMASLQK